LDVMPAERLDAVYVSHGHPDHCADLNPLLRARAFAAAEPPPLPVYAPRGALDAVLALDRPGMLDAALEHRDFEPGAGFAVGPFELRTTSLPHWEPNAAVRVAAGGRAVVYTGDGGPHPALVELARSADVLVAEATYPEHMTVENAPYLCTARQAARQAAQAGVGRLVLTHQWPGTEPGDHLAAAAKEYDGPTCVATSGLSFDV